MSAQDVRNRDYYYDVLLLNGRVLPAKKSRFCTLEYLYLVAKNEVWTPDCQSFVKRNCVYRPHKSLILAEVQRAARV